MRIIARSLRANAQAQGGHDSFIPEPYKHACLESGHCCTVDQLTLHIVEQYIPKASVSTLRYRDLNLGVEMVGESIGAMCTDDPHRRGISTVLAQAIAEPGGSIPTCYADRKLALGLGRGL